VVDAGAPVDHQRDLTAQGMAVAYWAETAPDRAAIVSDSGSRSFAELNRRANQLASALRRRGLRAGDGVALIARNRPEVAEVWAACERSGFRLTAVNWHLTAGEAAYVVDDSAARALVADTGSAELAVAAEAAAPRVDVKLAIDGPIESFDRYDDIVDAEPGDDIDDPTPGTFMLYTSGTTGRPKGVCKPPVAPPVDNLAGYRGDSVHLCTGPLYHAAPITISMVSPLRNGATVVVMDHWEPEETLRLIEQHGVTHTHMVPTMFHRLLALDDETRARYDLSSLRLVVHGAAPCPVAVKQAMIQWLGPVVVEYYAATEGAGTLVDSASWLRKPGTVGKPVAERVRVGDDRGQPLPAGEIGLVWLEATGGERFHYFGDEAKTARAYAGDYYTLGDLGYLDEDGYLFLTDRDANLVVSGGVNVYPAEVDAVLLEHPGVADVAAIGVPSEEWGEELLAVVQLKPGVDATHDLARELVAFCRDRLAHFKCPRSIDFVERLPRDDNGKIYKRRLRDEYRAALTTPPPPGAGA
jgi:long-chain acyl-CoA synthetase